MQTFELPDEELDEDVEALLRRIGRHAVDLPTWATSNDRNSTRFGYL